MQNIITLLFCCILAIIAYYDFKYRALPVYILVLAAILGILVSISKNGLSSALYYTGVNIMLITLQLGITTLYFSARNRKIVNIFDTYLGIGDVIFFLAVVFCFSPLNFIIFLISSGLITLIIYALHKDRVLIPLAGNQAIFLCIILLLSVAFKAIQPYNDLFLIDIFSCLYTF